MSGAAVGGLLGCGRGLSKKGKSRRGRVIVLAFDGMDPKLIRNLMETGRVPNFSRLAQMGAFTTVSTSDPPQTPVAFSNIISGCHPGTHQIFDFIHRNPRADGPLPVQPFFSTSHVASSGSPRGLSLGKWRIPLGSSAAPELLRRGPAYWQPLVKQGATAAVYFLPSNYPPQNAIGPGKLACVSGMGTPDLLGGLGEFTLVTPNAPRRGKTVTGGKYVFAKLRGSSHRAELTIEGPENFLIDPNKTGGKVPHMEVPYVVIRDPQRDLVKIEIEGQTILLKQGEWSDWVALDFPTSIPGSTALEALQAQVSLPGMVRFYVKQVHPQCEIYITPVNIDPQRPVNQISQPGELADQLARGDGRYYTLGIPEDYNAMRDGALNEDEFLSQAYLAHNEREEMYRRALGEFEAGCLFYYFGTTDLVSHMFWRDRDPGHPGRDPEKGDRYAHVIDDLYVHVDGIVGETLDTLRDNDTLIVLSDHGFTSFRRSVNLNRLLYEHGYLVLKNGVKPATVRFFAGVDWSKTQAYALGLNSVFVNLRGREREGIVAPGQDQQQLVDKLAQLLLDLRDDEQSGDSPIKTVVKVADRFPEADFQIAPDLIVGYNHNYRIGWEAPLGGIAKSVLADNLEPWSGDHCVASELVPGMLMCSRPLHEEKADLTDVGPTMLELCGTPVPEEMFGRPLIHLS